jgi:hypothetical protein
MTADGNGQNMEETPPQKSQARQKTTFKGRTHRPTQALNLPCNLSTPTIPAAFPGRTVIDLFFPLNLTFSVLLVFS